jgi:hypothetical protein
MENELMEEFKIVYFEGDSDTLVDCVARQCSRSKSDVLKRIGRPGKKIHSHCPTVRGDGVVKKAAAKNRLEKTSKKPAQKDKQQVAKQMATLEANKVMVRLFVLVLVLLRIVGLLEYWTVELY